MYCLHKAAQQANVDNFRMQSSKALDKLPSATKSSVSR